MRPDGDRATLLLLDQNAGPGACRNLAVGQAFRSESPVVLFNDADDVSHPDRVRVVRDVLRAEPEVDFVYSTIEVVDERLRPVDRSTLPPPSPPMRKSCTGWRTFAAMRLGDGKKPRESTPFR